MEVRVMSESNSSTPAVEYREVQGTDGAYRVGTDGTVWTRKNGAYGLLPTWRPMRLMTNASGHLLLELSYNGKRKMRLVHRLVLEAFVGLCPLGMESRHLNGNPKDNRLSNIKWDTRSENTKDRTRLNTGGDYGDRHHNAVLTAAIVLELRRRVAAGETCSQLARELGIRSNTIYLAVSGRSWSYLPGKVVLFTKAKESSDVV